MDAVKDKKKKLIKKKERNEVKDNKVKVNADRREINDTAVNKALFHTRPYVHKDQERHDDEILSDYETMLDYLEICSDMEELDVDKDDLMDDEDDEVGSDADGVLSWSSSMSDQSSSYTLQSMNNLLLANQICENPQEVEEWVHSQNPYSNDNVDDVDDYDDEDDNDDDDDEVEDEEDEEDDGEDIDVDIDDLSDDTEVSLGSLKEELVRDDRFSSSISDVSEDVDDIDVSP